MVQHSDCVLMINEILDDFLSNPLSWNPRIIAAAAKGTCKICLSLNESMFIVSEEIVVSKY